MKSGILALSLVLALGQTARADFGSCKQHIKAQAAAEGVSQATLARALDGLQPNDAVSFLGVQPEFSTPIWDYIAGLVDDERARDGRQRFAEYRQAALAAQHRFGVDAPALIAVWGVESDFGSSFGGRPIIQSLTTLACTPNRRSGYFHGELLAALKILDHGDVKLEEFNGSWAGAFGNTQFMPSTFLRLAVDTDGDGKRDVINSVPDALASTANFLHHAGWVQACPGASRSGFPPAIAARRAGAGKGRCRSGPPTGSPMSMARPCRAAAPMACSSPRDQPAPPFWCRAISTPFIPTTPPNPTLLRSGCFRTASRAATVLSRPGRPTIPAFHGSNAARFRRCWTQRGYDIGGKIDGVMGTKTREAIADYQRRIGMRPNGRASMKLLAALRAGK